MAIRNQDGFRKTCATTTAGKWLFLAWAVAGAGFQGCTTEDKASGPIGTGSDTSSIETEGRGLAGSAGNDSAASFLVDSVQQAGDEKKVDYQSGSSKDMVTTPFGKVERRCVYELEEGESIQDENTVVTKTGQLKLLDGKGCGTVDNTGKPLAKAPFTTHGWVMAGWWVPRYWVAELTSEFTVPRLPSSPEGQVLFFFSSFQTQNDDGWIVQPVLEYGRNGDYGGQYWVMGSWIVKGDGRQVSFRSKVVRVNPGDKLRGNILGHRCTTEGRCKWTVTTQNLTRGTTAQLASNLRLPAMTNVQGGALEAYDLSFCNQYPAQSRLDFTNIKVKDGDGWLRTPEWTEKLWTPQIPDCGFDVTMKQGTASSVGLHWKTNL